MAEKPFYVELADALEQTRREGGAVLRFADVIIKLERIDEPPTSTPEDSPSL